MKSVTEEKREVKISIPTHGFFLKRMTSALKLVIKKLIYRPQAISGNHEDSWKRGLLSLSLENKDK